MRSLLWSVVTAVLIAAVVLGFTIGVLASNLPRVVGRPDVVESRDLHLPAAKRLVLSNEDGSVQVRTHEGNQVWVQASIRVYAQSRRDKEFAATYAGSLIRTELDGDALRVVTEPEDRPDNVDVGVDYAVWVPPGTDIEIQGDNGNVWISKGCGRVSVRGRNTDIEITEPDGAVTAESTNGRIRVLDAPDGATIKTINGNVYAHMKGGALQATTTNGAIVARVLNPEVPSCSLTSRNGGITVFLLDNGSATVEAATKRGAIKSDFPVDCVSGVKGRRRLKGTIGAGHTTLKVETLNGNIWLARETL